METLQQFSIGLIQALQTLSPALDGVMNFFTFLGRAEFFLIIAPFIYWVLDKRLGIRALLAVFFTDVIASSFKLLFYQPRPYWIGGVKELSQESSYGIPSSHASDSLAIGGYLTYRVQKKWFGVLMGIVIFFIGLSRLYLGVHFLHDVLFGWLIGAAVFWVTANQSKQITAWMRSKSLSAQIGIGFAISAAIILLGIIIRSMIAGTPDPDSWRRFATEARSITNFFTLSGAFSGAIAGYALMRQKARFRPAENWGKRILSYSIGMVVLLLIYLGLDIVFSGIAEDESILGYLLRYIRYALATFWVTFGAPWIFIKTRLAEVEARSFNAEERSASTHPNSKNNIH